VSELGIGALFFACVFGGAMAGMTIRRALPRHHLTKETEDVVRLGAGVIATLSALVLGLLIASAKSSFDTKDSGVRQFSADLILLAFWLAIIFGTFGLFAPRNTTAVVALAVCALSISGSIFLVLEMDRPFGGLIQVSSAPMREALRQIRQ
jgi:hypothetical protein